MCDIHEFMSYFIQNNFVKINLKKKFSVKPFFLQKKSKFLLRICGAESQFLYVKIFHINVKKIHSTPPLKIVNYSKKNGRFL